MVAINEMVQERTVDLQTVKAHFYETGTGYPTIFLHGLGYTSGGEDWFPAIKEGIGDVVHVIALDQLGWGAVDRPNWRYNFSYLVDHVRELQDALGLKKTNIVGHSLGGWVGATLAYESPNRVNKLVLVANAGLNPPPPNFSGFHIPNDEEIDKSIVGDLDPEMRQTLAAARKHNANREGGFEAYQNIAAMFQDMDMRRRQYLERRLKYIEVPTQLIYGELDLIYPPVDGGRELFRDTIPNVEYHLLPNTGHMIPTERPKEMTALLKAFLKE